MRMVTRLWAHLPLRVQQRFGPRPRARAPTRAASGSTIRPRRHRNQVVWRKSLRRSRLAEGCQRRRRLWPQDHRRCQARGGNVWDGGWIYNPEKKKTYDVELTPLDENRLRVKGYAGTKFLSKTMIWTRAPAELIRCHAKSEQVAAAAPEAASNAAPPVTATGSTAPKDAAPALKPSVSETPKAGTPEPRKEANARPQN